MYRPEHTGEPRCDCTACYTRRVTREDLRRDIVAMLRKRARAHKRLARFRRYHAYADLWLREHHQGAADALLVMAMKIEREI